MSKYRATKVITEDGKFDSKKEYYRWLELKALEKAGEITDLKRQVKFQLLPPQKATERTERAVYYVCDFLYTENGKSICEDVKGFKTKDYILKRKMMLYFYGIAIRETH